MTDHTISISIQDESEENKPSKPNDMEEKKTNTEEIENAEKGENERKISQTKTRRVGTTVAPEVPTLAPPAINSNLKRKISFADEKEYKATFHVTEDPIVLDTNLADIAETDAVPTPFDPQDESRDKLTNFQKRQMRFSTASRLSYVPSFSALASRPSMASLKSAMSKANLELYPERGSFIASLGRSFAEMPAVAQKLYIITQVLAAISVSMGSMAVGFTGGYTATALPSMKEEANSTFSNDTFSNETTTFQLTETEESWVVSLMPLSAMLGSITGASLIDKLGRKMLILLCGPPFFAGYIIIGSASNVWMLYIGRIVCGLCVGLLTLSLPVYLGETIQAEIRGTLGLLPTTFGNCGILLCYLIGTYLNWSWHAYVGAIIPLIFFCMMIFVPETPRWYVSKGRDEHAEASLQWLRGSENDIQFELAAIQDNFDKSEQESSTLRAILKIKYMKPFGLAIGLMIVQQLSGINAVINYAVKIFQEVGSSFSEHISTIIIGVVNALSTFIANAVIDKLGRKILLYISTGIMIISLFILGTYFIFKENKYYTDSVETLSWIPLVCLMLYIVAFSLGWGPIPWLFMGEALPAKIRGPLASVVTAFNWFCSFIVTKTFTDLKETMGAGGVFFFYGVVMILGGLFSFFFIPETKGKTLEEIEAELSGSKAIGPRQRRISEMSGIYIK